MIWNSRAVAQGDAEFMRNARCASEVLRSGQWGAPAGWKEEIGQRSFDFAALKNDESARKTPKSIQTPHSRHQFTCLQAYVLKSNYEIIAFHCAELYYPPSPGEFIAKLRAKSAGRR